MSVVAPILLILAVAGIFTVVGWLVLRTVRSNRALRDPTVGSDLAALAQRRGWTYTAELRGYPQRYTYHPFRGSPHESAYELVTGTHRGRSFACFQYHVPRSGGDQDAPLQRNYMRVCTLSLPGPVPHLMITSARWNPKWTRGFTTGDPAFDERFLVATSDEAFAHQVLREPVKRWLHDHPPLAGQPKGALRFVGEEIIGWYPENHRFDTRLLGPNLDYLCDLLDRIPPEVLR